VVLNTASVTGRLTEIFDTMYRMAQAVIESFDKKVAVVDARPVVQQAPPEERIYLDEERRDVIRDLGRTSLDAVEVFARGLQVRDPTEQVNYFTRAVRLDPEYSLAYYRRGDAHYACGDYHGALRDYHRTTVIAPRYPEAYYRKGIVYEQIGRPRLALKSYRNYVRVAPSRRVQLVDRLRSGDSRIIRDPRIESRLRRSGDDRSRSRREDDGRSQRKSKRGP
jgi:tetratricopeptide (TPR) repeat protein